MLESCFVDVTKEIRTSKKKRIFRIISGFFNLDT